MSANTPQRYPTPWFDAINLCQRDDDHLAAAGLKAERPAGQRQDGMAPARRRAMPRSFAGSRRRWRLAVGDPSDGQAFATEVETAGRLPTRPGDKGNEYAALDRPKNAGAQNIYGVKFAAIEGGWVRLEDYMGSDAKIADHARMSTQAGDKAPKDGGVRHLLRYMLRHRHTSPFEFAVIVVHVRCPLYIARQWMRHRMGTFSEVSGRYVELTADGYRPEPGDLAFQSTANHQGRAGALPGDAAARAHELMCASMDESAAAYRALLDEGLSREQARILLPLSTFTEFRWKVDLHNLLHFLSLRLDEHAQDEMRSFALALCNIVAAWMPLTFEAWREYTFNAVRLGELEHRITLALLHRGDLSPENAQNADHAAREALRLGDRELGEMAVKLGYPADGFADVLRALLIDGASSQE